MDEVRAIWNAMIDRRPAVIVRCADAADVAASIGFARERGLEISIRGGGHNIAGTSVCDGGVMIDLSQMKQVRVDAVARRAHVEPGALPLRRRSGHARARPGGRRSASTRRPVSPG
jgi:FAD/FMN-containing dehydrogenase